MHYLNRQSISLVNDNYSRKCSNEAKILFGDKIYIWATSVFTVRTRELG